MALLTAIRPAASGTVVAGAAVSSSDTIAAADLGTLGAYLLVTNGSGGSINVTVSDSSVTPAGNAASTSAVAVANSTTKGVFVGPKTVNPSTGVTTVTFSGTSSVTYQLLPLG
jgi:hypothetical protein